MVAVGKNVKAEYYLKIQRALWAKNIENFQNCGLRRIGCYIRTMCLVIVQLLFGSFLKKIMSKSLVTEATQPTWLLQTSSYSLDWNRSLRGGGELWQSVEVLKKKFTTILNFISAEEWQHCASMTVGSIKEVHCIGGMRNNFERDKINFKYIMLFWNLATNLFDKLWIIVQFSFLGYWKNCIFFFKF